MSRHFTVIGEALIDLVETAPATFAARPGGSSFNVAVSLARLGQPVSLVARTGRDGFGELLRAQATRDGVDLSHWEQASEPTSLAIATLDGAGQARYDFYLDATAALVWGERALDALPLAGSVLHVGSIASWWPPAHELIHHVQRQAYDAGQTLISYDPNVRSALLGEPGRARAVIEHSVAAAHVVKASEEDLAWLYPGEPLAAIAARWCRLGPHLVVVTLGGAGAIAYSRAGLMTRRSAPAVQVVDTVGAGDSFTGGLLAALARFGLGDPSRFAAAVSAGDPKLLDALDQAITVAAMTCERRGADPPTEAELRERLQTLDP